MAFVILFRSRFRSCCGWGLVFLYSKTEAAVGQGGVRWGRHWLNRAQLVLLGNQSKKLMGAGAPSSLSAGETGREGMETRNQEGREGGAGSCVTVSVLDEIIREKMLDLFHYYVLTKTPLLEQYEKHIIIWCFFF